MNVAYKYCTGTCNAWKWENNSPNTRNAEKCDVRDVAQVSLYLYRYCTRTGGTVQVDYTFASVAIHGHTGTYRYIRVRTCTYSTGTSTQTSR